MEVRVDGKVALVTGASRGIGEAIAAELIHSGAEGVVITSRRAENLEGAVERLAESTGEKGLAYPIVARADDPDHAQSAVAETVERFGSCDILVNNAGTNPSAGNLVDVDMGAVDKTWAVNQRGPLLWTRAAWEGWMAENGGVILNMASVGGMVPSAVLGAYNVSKAALIHLTRQLAFEMAPKVRVNALAPGVVKTRLAELLWTSDEKAAGRIHPMGRLGEPADIAHAAVFLCSDQASWITGVTLPVDGGLSGASPTGIA